MNPNAKMQTLDDIIAMMDDAQMQRIPGREQPALPPEIGGASPGIMSEQDMLDAPAQDPMDIGGELPGIMSEQDLSGTGGDEMSMDMSEEDLQALMAMYGDEEEEAY